MILKHFRRFSEKYVFMPGMQVKVDKKAYFDTEVGRLDKKEHEFGGQLQHVL